MYKHLVDQKKHKKREIQTQRKRLTAIETEKALEIEKERDIDLEFYAGRNQSCLFFF